MWPLHCSVFTKPVCSASVYCGIITARALKNINNKRNLGLVIMDCKTRNILQMHDLLHQCFSTIYFFCHSHLMVGPSTINTFFFKKEEKKKYICIFPYIYIYSSGVTTTYLLCFYVCLCFCTYFNFFFYIWTCVWNKVSHVTLVC